LPNLAQACLAEINLKIRRFVSKRKQGRLLKTLLLKFFISC
jgi:hypothetical protein